MRAAVCHVYGPPSCLVVEDVVAPEPGVGEVSVKVAAAAVNFPDVLIMADRYQVSVPLPFTPGSEFAGTVVAVGEGVETVAVGDEVFGATFHGAFAEQVTVAAASLKRVPAGVDVASMAGFWVAHATAFHSLRSVAEVSPGERVLVLGAAGGVGLAAVELAALLGAEVIAAASSEAKLAECRRRGAAHTIDYSAGDLRGALRAVAAEGVDVVIDPVGGPFAEQALRSTRWGGRFVTIGYASGEIPRIPLNLVLLKGVVIKGFEMRSFGGHARELVARNEAELMELVISGRLRPHATSRHPLDRVADALAEVAERRAIGKVLVIP